MSEIRNEILQRRQAAEDYLSTKRQMWDSAEKLFHNKLADAISETTKSQVFDPKLSTLTIERGYRVMAQMGVGKAKALSKNDVGGSTLMNLILDKYILPNANAQFDFLTKVRMIDIYSNVYGNFFALVDWDIKKNGYVGPDLWLLNIRDVFPQVGAASVDDSDYMIVRTWKPMSYFENLDKKDGFKNIDKIVRNLKGRTGSRQGRGAEQLTEREVSQYPQSAPAKGKGYFEVLTQYEGDRWVDFCVDADMEFRDQDNPHDDGELPIVAKYSIPLLDDFMGMSDFERGGSMQNVINSVWNLYLDAVKMSIFPPVLINKDNVASASSFKWGPTEKWLARGQVDNVAKTLTLSPQGIPTFNNTYQVANAAILNLFGTTDTAVSAETDPGMGKTPEALKMQGARENTRDNADRFYVEQFLKKTIKKMINLVSKKQKSAVVLRLFEDEIKELAKSYPDIEEMYDEKSGKLTIRSDKFGSTLYDYEIISGSTFAVDEKAQQDNLTQLLTLFIKSQTPQGNLLISQLKQDGYNLKFGELFKRIVSKMGIQDWDKILEEMSDEEKDRMTLNQDAEQFRQAMEQFQGSEIPAQPGGNGQTPPPGATAPAAGPPGSPGEVPIG